MVQHCDDAWPDLTEIIAKLGWSLPPAPKGADVLSIMLRHDGLRSYCECVTRCTNRFLYWAEYGLAFANASDLSRPSSTRCTKVGSLRYRAAAYPFASFRQIPTASDLILKN